MLNLNSIIQSIAYSILLEETVDCAVQCSHVLYPSSAIFLDRLSFLMSTPNREWSLIALLNALLSQQYVRSILLFSFSVYSKID